MKKVFLYEPSIASNNLGDEVIVEGCKNALSGFLDKNYVVEFPTHTPLSNRYYLFMGKPDYKIVCGSNIITGKMNQLRHVKQWALNYSTTWQLNNSIFIGVGAQKYQSCNFYTKNIYKKMFNPSYIHSVRDSYTEQFLKNNGIDNVINTGCPTMWSLTKSHCENIPKKKSENVVLTLTDYSQNVSRDEYLIHELLEHYTGLYFWPQGIDDYIYFKNLKGSSNFKIISSSLSKYDDFLNKINTDFVGTRLHGGMRALQHKRRAIIIGIDNRAIELKKDYNIPVLHQKDLKELSTKIESNFDTNISINHNNISIFLKQFGIDY